MFGLIRSKKALEIKLENKKLLNVLDAMTRTFVIINADNTVLNGNIIKVPKDKDGIYISGNNVLITGCTIDGGGKGVVGLKIMDLK